MKFYKTSHGNDIKLDRNRGCRNAGSFVPVPQSQRPWQFQVGIKLILTVKLPNCLCMRQMSDSLAILTICTQYHESIYTR